MAEVIINKLTGQSNPHIYGLEPGRTRFLDGCYSQYGRIIGRGGYTVLGSALAADVIGLFAFKDSALAEHLIAATTSDIYEWNGSSWADINATAFISAGAATDVAHAFDTGGANLMFVTRTTKVRYMATPFTAITNNANAPSGRLVAKFETYFLCGYSEPSTNGTVANQQPDIIRYSTTLTGTWTTGQTFGSVTEGALLNWGVQGRTLYMYKDDCIAAMRFIGGTTIMSILRVPFALGMLSPRSYGQCGAIGDIFLATDRKLWLNANGDIRELRPEVNATILNESGTQDLSTSVAVVDLLNGIYSLFYPDASSGFHRLMFNYSTGEFVDILYPNITPRTGVFSRKVATTGNIFLNFSADDKTYKIDDGLVDNTASVDRFWQTDWQELGNTKYKVLNTAFIRVKPVAGAQYAVSVATDYESTFYKREIFTSKLIDTKKDEEFVYKPRVRGKRFNLKIELLPQSVASDCELRAVEMYADDGTPGKEPGHPAIGGV